MSNMPSLTPELAELSRQFTAARDDATELLNGLNETQFNWRPSPRDWSIAECLLHLNIVGDRWVHILEPVLTEARAHGPRSQGPFAFSGLGKRILARTEPPAKHKSKAPRTFTPADGQPITAVLPTFHHLQGQLALQLEQASGLDLARIKVPTPEMRLVRFNLHLTFAWIAAHERRHLWQARQVLNHPKFPH